MIDEQWIDVAETRDQPEEVQHAGERIRVDDAGGDEQIVKARSLEFAQSSHDGCKHLVFIHVEGGALEVQGHREQRHEDQHDELIHAHHDRDGRFPNQLPSHDGRRYADDNQHEPWAQVRGHRDRGHHVEQTKADCDAEPDHFQQ